LDDPDELRRCIDAISLFANQDVSNFLLTFVTFKNYTDPKKFVRKCGSPDIIIFDSRSDLKEVIPDFPASWRESECFLILDHSLEIGKWTEDINSKEFVIVGIYFGFGFDPLQFEGRNSITNILVPIIQLTNNYFKY
jgi:hypothetical protein